MAEIFVCKQEELPPGKMTKCSIDGKDEIVVANVSGNIHAMRGLCNHQGGPLAEGEIEEKVITCPWHGAKWDVTTGNLVEFALELDPEPVYKVVLKDDGIFLEL
jgi:nitrite reductase/ring-hydroxylating ferredoxin subunit